MGTVIAIALVAFVVLLLIGGWRAGGNEARANRYLSDRYRDDKRRRR